MVEGTILTNDKDLKLPVSLLSANSNLTEHEIKQIEKLIVRDLSRLAHTYMRRERAGHTLGPIGLLNETLLRVCTRLDIYKDKEHFYATAARIMRHVLVDYEKQRGAKKRGGDLMRADVALDQVTGNSDGIALLELHDLIEKMEALDQQMATIVDLKYFGGFTLEQITRTLGLSESTVRRQLDFGKHWLLLQLKGESISITRAGGEVP